MGQKQRVIQQPAWILHTMPWRETSLIVEVFARDYGRMALVAKGARRPYSTLRGVLMAFQPLLLDWSGGGEVKTLARAEWQGGQTLLTGLPLLCGYYLNELLVRLTAREDPHSELFQAYAEATGALSRAETVPPILRRFELMLLQMLGYAPRLESESDGSMAVRPLQYYRYALESGPIPVDEHGYYAEEPLVSGQTLLDMAQGSFSRAETLLQSKRLLRTLLDHYLGDQPLQSRRVLRELQEL